MPRLSSEKFREMLRNDGHPYTLTSKSDEPVDINFPNLPDWHRDGFEDWHHRLPEACVFCIEYKGLNYKILTNVGNPDCNDGNFGAVFDGNNDKILDIIPSGDTETTLQSLKIDEMKISDDFQAKLSPYLENKAILHDNTEFEYVVFKVLVENDCILDLIINEIDDWAQDDENEEKDRD